MFRRFIHKFNEYRFEKRMAKQRYKRGFSDSDCWNMNYWLTSTFPDMILRLRDMKHGAPELPFEEFDNLPLGWKDRELQKYKIIQEKNGYEYEPDSIFTKWYILLTRMAYCLKEADGDKEMYNPYENDYNIAVWDDDFYNEKTFTNFWDKWRYKEEMKDEALDLLKKYFYNLWD